MISDEEAAALEAHIRELDQDQKVADALLPIDTLLVRLRVEFTNPDLSNAGKKLIVNQIDEAKRQRDILLSSSSDSFRERDAQRQS